jgi:hypothetical protein
VAVNEESGESGGRGGRGGWRARTASVRDLPRL